MLEKEKGPKTDWDKISWICIGGIVILIHVVVIACNMYFKYFYEYSDEELRNHGIIIREFTRVESKGWVSDIDFENTVYEYDEMTVKFSQNLYLIPILYFQLL
jgi:hypothetical protein